MTDDPPSGSGGSGSGLPPEIIQSIAISNAKSIGEQPAILANLALANQILNTNLQQQVMISNQQAMNQIAMATMSKCVSLVCGDDGKDPKSAAALKELVDLLKTMQSGAAAPPATATVAATPAAPTTPPAINPAQG